MAKRPIPFARNSSHFVHIQNCLASVLNKIKAIPGLTPKVLWVSCRLNRSNTQDQPVFVGWVEDSEAINVRVQKGQPYAPIEFRFGDTHRSRLYSQCLAQPVGTVLPRTWASDQADADSQKIGEKAHGETDRRSVPIRINNLYVGTLNAAFLGDPAGNDAALKDILVQTAQAPTSDLVKYIKDNLEFSGPPHP